MRSRSLPAVLFATAFAPLLSAQASWSMLYPTFVPLRLEASFGVHETTGKAVLLWGYENGQPATTAWVLTDTSWVVQPGAVPPFRNQAALAFDSARDVLLVFGGNQPGFSTFDDTWQWNGSQWSQLQTAVRPPARVGATMACDRARGVVVLFGGFGAQRLADTWEWNGVTWTQRATAVAPAPRDLATMAFDPVGGGVLLYGGIGDGPGGGAALTDTWTWDGTSWSQRTPATPPPFRVNHRMATDVGRQRIVLFGGQGGDAFTWEWNGSEWHAAGIASPGSRYGFGLGYDALRRRLVLHGGATFVSGVNYFFHDTWIYRTPLPASVAPFGSGCAGTVGTPSLAAAPFTLPWLGDTTRHVVDAIPPNEAGAAFVSSFGSIPPIPLGSAGMPGCDLLVPTDVVEFRAAAAGRAEWALAIPNAVALAGVQFRQQAFVLDSAANALGLVASNGVTATLGVR